MRSTAIISLLSGLLPVASALATPSQGSPLPRRRIHTAEEDLASYEDSCNIGFCSIAGATIGGWGSKFFNVSTVERFASLAAAAEPIIMVLSGPLSGNNTQVAIGSSKTIVGAPGSSLTGISLLVNGSRNVILRNLKISKIPTGAPGGSLITVLGSRSVWVDHCDLSSGFGDGGSLLSIGNGSDWMTVTNTLFHDSPSAAIVGGNAAADTGKLHVTFAGNYWRNVNDTPAFSFGTGHIINSYHEGVTNGIATLSGAQLLIESNVFANSSGRAIYGATLGSANDTVGSATVHDVPLIDGSSNTATPGNMTPDSLPYPYDLLGSDKVKESVLRNAGQILQYMDEVNWA